MKKIELVFSSLIFLLGNLYASPINFDIYGVNSELQKKIFSTCKADIREYDHLSQQIKLSLKLDPRMIKRHEVETSIIKKVHALGDFSFVSISTITYLQNQATYSTLDIVQKNDNNRFPKSSSQHKKRLTKKSEGLKKLFQTWNNYNNRSLMLMSQNKFDMKARSCPVIHCAWGFDKNELKKDFPELKEGASQYKEQLIEVIKYSQNDEERAQAIFILANTNDYLELARLMMSLTNDSSDLVRNNAMRVLAAIVSKYYIHNLDAHHILLALNYPYVTDRNKAAYVLWNMVRKDKSIHALVIKEGGNTLLNLLKLKQPNNHDPAFLILKEISHQNYSENDYQHWQQWIDQANKKLKKS